MIFGDSVTSPSVVLNYCNRFEASERAPNFEASCSVKSSTSFIIDFGADYTKQFVNWDQYGQSREEVL